MNKCSRNRLKMSFLLSPRNVAAALFFIPLLTHAQAVSSDTAPMIDNARVAAWKLTLEPSQAEKINHHGNDFVVAFLSAANVKTASKDGHTAVSSKHFGDVIYGRGEDEYTEEATSKTPAQIVVVELKNSPSPSYNNGAGHPAAFPRPGSKKILENDRIIVWNYSFTPGVQTPVHYHAKDAVVMYRYDGAVKSTTLDGKSTVVDSTFGTVRFSKGDRTHIEELSRGRQSILVIELK